MIFQLTIKVDEQTTLHELAYALRSASDLAATWLNNGAHGVGMLVPDDSITFVNPLQRLSACALSTEYRRIV